MNGTAATAVFPGRLIFSDWHARHWFKEELQRCKPRRARQMRSRGTCLLST
jgi:hypothetical protein